MTTRNGMSRRAWLALVSLAAVAPRVAGATTATTWMSRPLAARGPLQQIRAAEGGGVLAIATDGTLWHYTTPDAPRKLADGLDAATPVAAGYGRIAGRTREGGLFVLADGRDQTTPGAGLAPNAGFAHLPFAIIGIVAAGTQFHVARFEPAGGRWIVSDRSSESVMPDARPVLATRDGRPPAGDPGEVVVFAGPDEGRYDHGVLGDRIEATRVLMLERHSLQTLRELSLPAPYVFEDIAPRVVADGLLTIRSGGTGSRLALVGADPARAKQLRIAALGEPVGGPHRWLAPTTDGRRVLAIHTPHIGGVLAAYRIDGEHLRATVVATEVANHRNGTRELDLAVWRGDTLIAPAQDGRRLRVFDGAGNWAEQASIALPSRVTMTAALADPARFAVLLDDGAALVVERDR